MLLDMTHYKMMANIYHFIQKWGKLGLSFSWWLYFKSH